MWRFKGSTGAFTSWVFALFLVSNLLTKAEIFQIQTSPSSYPDSLFTSPEKTLETYIHFLRTGDEYGARHCFKNPRYPNSLAEFHLREPIDIRSYQIVRKMLYIPENRTDWFDGNPPGREGDIELDVLNIEGGVVGGVERDDLRVMYTYYLREFDGKWYIIGHTAWGVS